jgi:simple sugar transport system permease protein
MTIKRKIRNTDLMIRGIVLIAILIIFSIINPSILSGMNIISLLNNSIFIGCMAMAMLIIAVTGELDLSLMAIAFCGGYGTTMFHNSLGSSGNLVTMFLVGGVIGMLCGLLNGFFVYRFRIPGFVVSIATMLIFLSILPLVFGKATITDMPAQMVRLDTVGLYEYRAVEGGPIAKLNISFLLLIISVAIVWFLLNKTTVGRGIYAVGGDIQSAERVGFNLALVYGVAYATFGFICGMTGVMFFANNRIVLARAIAGKEINVIAALILGGVNLTNSKGTVAGTLIGVGIITLIDSSLIMLGISPYAQKMVIGLVILVSVYISSLVEWKKSN